MLLCFKVPAGTEADLTITAKITQLYVCRVNDHFCNWVFSDWVKVKVLDIDKSGMYSYFDLYCSSVVLLIVVIVVVVVLHIARQPLPVSWQSIIVCT